MGSGPTRDQAAAVEGGLIGRARELERLSEAADQTAAGTGSLLLLAGDAGIGKTSLADAATAGFDGPVLHGAASRDAPLPHGPVVSALRSYLRTRPGGLVPSGALGSHLALLLPELGEPPAESEQGTLFEAVRETLAGIGPSMVVLDDLQWSDDATLDLLAFLAGAIADQPTFALGIYRSDELTRTHSLRRLRAELRRQGILDEVTIEPLAAEQSTELAERVLGGAISPSLGRTIHDRTQGVPFFVEEVSHALRASGLVRPGDSGLQLDRDKELPVPETIRDAVLIRSAALSAPGREAAEVSAVAGQTFSLDLVARLSSESGLEDLIEQGLVRDIGDGRAAFRHALVREAIYGDVPWLRRRGLHRDLAESLASTGVSSYEIANHWLAAKEDRLAREMLVKAVDEYRSVHAYRDAVRAGRVALDLWEPDDAADERLSLLERYAGSAELAGELPEAARAWREVADINRKRGATHAVAEATRRLAGVYALEGDRVRATDARRQSADAFAAAGAAEEAAADRLVAAGYLQRRGEHTEAEELAGIAETEASASGRLDLQAEALGLKGVARAKRGDLKGGVEMANAGLSLALEHGLTARAGSLYQCLGTALEAGGDYGGAREAMASAIDFCEAAGAAEKQRVCWECMVYLQRELGEWSRAEELCAELAGDGSSEPSARVVVDGIRGAIAGFRGDTKQARSLLGEVNEVAIRIDLLSMQVDSSAALAFTAELDGDVETAASHCRFLLQRWGRSEDRHYAVWGLRWASSFFARQGDGEQARACAEALGRIAADSGNADALAALAHALGETALLDGENELAAEQFARALELHQGLEIPFERAQISLRAGTALAAAGERDQALERLTDAHRVARKLGAQPLMTAAAEEVARLGESVEKRLGRRAAAAHEGAGLTRRELEVMRLVATGVTNQEIADELFISRRTVDMHVRNILAKLECRSRVEAAGKAAELGLIDAG